MKLGILRAVAFSWAFVLPTAWAHADTAVMAPGSAAVTAFSGVPATKSDQPIDLDGPSLRVLGLPGGEFGLADSEVRYTAIASDLGQVFGVAIDSEPQPNIYAAATSAYGLAIFTAQGRVNRGAAGASYAPGQFGPADKNGGPNSIWRIDGRTGEVTLFANVETDNVGPQPASLGGLAFDPASRQLFAADRATGLIHRFAMNGKDLQTYDHGVAGRTAAGLTPEPFDPAGLADITNHDFRTQAPDTWGMAAPERRVFALAVHNGRLYYSVADGPSIWSVGIARDGSFAGDPRFETKLGSLHRGIEITSIAFDGRGWMYTAERGATTGDADFVAVADDGKSRVKRVFSPKPANDPTPGLWIEPGQDYAIGLLPDYHNADGGAALSCARVLWSTGERLLDQPNADPDSFAHIDGLQGNDAGLVEPANMPPEKSWFVNYYDEQADPASRGHMGAIAIWNVCGGTALPPPPPRFHSDCPEHSYWLGGECRVAPSCPPGAYFRRGFCFYEHCPWGFWRDGNRCVRPPQHCRRDEIWSRDDRGGRCIPIGCPERLRATRFGYCGCPDGAIWRDGQCVRRPPCDPWLFRATNGTCRRCPDGSLPRDGVCRPRPCDPAVLRIRDNPECPCPDGSRRRDGQCGHPCDPQRLHAINSGCPCPDGSRPRDGRCGNKPPCDPAALRILNNGCPCPDGSQRRDGRCGNKPPCDPAALRTNNIGGCPCPDGTVPGRGGCVHKKPPCGPSLLVVPGCEKPHRTLPRVHIQVPPRHVTGRKPGHDNGGNNHVGGNNTNNGGNGDNGRGGRHHTVGPVNNGGEHGGGDNGHGRHRPITGTIHPAGENAVGGGHGKPALHTRVPLTVPGHHRGRDDDDKHHEHQN